MRIEILVFDGVDEMDVMGPYAVWTRAVHRTDVELTLVGLDGPGEVTGMNGLQFRATHALGTPDALFVPGGGWMNRATKGSWAEAQRGAMTQRIAELAPTLQWVGSVCTGSMLLAAAGLVQGRPATTNRNAWAELATYGADVKTNRVVDDGDLVTAGGITAGIDLALHVVERAYGAEPADGIAAAMEYTRDRDLYRSVASSN